MKKRLVFKNILPNRSISVQDIASILIFLLLFSWYAYSVRLGFGRIDEGFYLTVVQRLLKGDRLLVDEWQFTQLSSIFQVLPYWLYTRITGGNEGSVLFMRYMFVGIQCVLYWYTYMKLRSQKTAGLVGTVFFFMYVPFAIFTMSYYNMALQALLIACIIMFINKSQSRLELLFVGVLCSCAAILFPPLILVYILWCVFVAVRKILQKNNRDFRSYFFLFEGRTWGTVSVGIAVCVAAFFLYIQLSEGLDIFASNFHNLFTDSEYSYEQGGYVYSYHIQKILFFIDLFGWPGIVLFVASYAGAFFYRFHRGNLIKNKILFRFIILLIALFAAATGLVWALINRESNPSISYTYFSFISIPISLIGGVSHLLCEKRNPRVFCFFIVGAIASLIQDCFSSVTLGLFFSLGIISTAIITKDLLQELFAEKTENRQKTYLKKRKYERGISSGIRKVFLSIFVIGISVISIAEVMQVYFAGAFPAMESYDNSLSSNARKTIASFNSRIENGPYKGIYTTATIKKRHEAVLSDLEAVREVPECKFYITDLQPAGYLYVNNPIGTYSTWFVDLDENTRNGLYWSLFPDRFPDYVYIPKYSGMAYLPTDMLYGANWINEKLKKWTIDGACEINKVETGYIIQITDKIAYRNAGYY